MGVVVDKVLEYKVSTRSREISIILCCERECELEKSIYSYKSRWSRLSTTTGGHWKLILICGKWVWKETSTADGRFCPDREQSTTPVSVPVPISLYSPGNKNHIYRFCSTALYFGHIASVKMANIFGVQGHRADGAVWWRGDCWIVGFIWARCYQGDFSITLIVRLI